MGIDVHASRVARGALQAIVLRLSDAERKEYFNLHYWRYVETLKEMITWSGKRVLDIGIVPGHMAMALRHLGCEVSGITDDRLLQGMNGRWAAEKIAVSRAIVDKEPLPFPDDSFDGVLFTEVLEHLLYDPRKLVDEIYRVMRPNGELVVSTPNVLRIENKIKVILGRNIYPRHENFYFSDLYRRHNREYTMQELIDLFKPRFVTKKMRYIMMTDFAVPMSDNGKVFDIHEYAEVGKLRGNGYGSRRNLKETAKLFLRLPKVLYPPFRSGLLVSFVSSKSTPQGRETT
jgi:2-polyprenyl-3-methyl-5-hydroxy-6-metoxy-1,4-benzoquinol methylase